MKPTSNEPIIKKIKDHQNLFITVLLTFRALSYLDEAIKETDVINPDTSFWAQAIEMFGTYNVKLVFHDECFNNHYEDYIKLMTKISPLSIADKLTFEHMEQLSDLSIQDAESMKNFIIQLSKVFGKDKIIMALFLPIFNQVLTEYQKMRIEYYCDEFEDPLPSLLHSTSNIWKNLNMSDYQIVENTLPENSEHISSVNTDIIKNDNSTIQDVAESEQVSVTKYCRFCGSKIPFDSIYCEKCGKKLI